MKKEFAESCNISSNGNYILELNRIAIGVNHRQVFEVSNPKTKPAEFCGGKTIIVGDMYFQSDGFR